MKNCYPVWEFLVTRTELCIYFCNRILTRTSIHVENVVVVFHLYIYSFRLATSGFCVSKLKHNKKNKELL